MTKRILLTLTLTAALAAPAVASAGDKTLLSGYGGPGGDEQSLLGGGLLPAPRGDGSLRASGSRAAAVSTATGTAPGAGGPATESGQDGATGTGRPQPDSAAGAPASGKAAIGGKRGEGRGASPRDRASGSGRSSAGDTESTGSAADGSARVRPIVYPSANAAGALPVRGSDALLLMLGLAVLLLVGTASWGFSRHPGPASLETDP